MNGEPHDVEIRSLNTIDRDIANHLLRSISPGFIERSARIYVMPDELITERYKRHVCSIEE